MQVGPVRFVTTGDGFRIAYTITGIGTPLIVIPPGLHDMQSLWGFKPVWMNGLAERFQVVVLDVRGRGLSSHGLTEAHSYTDYELDIAAVIDVLNLDAICLFAVGGFAHNLIRYAIANPQRVKALIFNNTPLSVAAYPRSYMEGLAAENWHLFITTLTPQGADAKAVREWRERLLLPGVREDWAIASAVNSGSSVEQELPQLQAPCLVFHSRDHHLLGLDETMRFAERIPDARIVLIDGNPMDALGAVEGLPALDSFLHDIGLVPPPPAQLAPVPGAEADDEVAVRLSLSARQVEVLKLLAEGRTTREISERLVLSERTVERHIADVYNKIGARNRAEATAYALRHYT